MADMEKVINGLKLLAHWPDALIITDKEKWIKSCCEMAIALLKEQDPVKPHYNARTNWYECGACHYSMTSGMHCRSELIPATKVRYCANCGFPVNWEGR